MGDLLVTSSPLIYRSLFRDRGVGQRLAVTSVTLGCNGRVVIYFIIVRSVYYLLHSRGWRHGCPLLHILMTGPDILPSQVITKTLLVAVGKSSKYKIQNFDTTFVYYTCHVKRNLYRLHYCIVFFKNAAQEPDVWIPLLALYTLRQTLAKQHYTLTHGCGV